MKKFIYLLILVVAFSACSEEKKQSDYVKVIIADRVLKVHRGYFDSSPPSGSDTESMVIEYSLPDFGILPRDKNARQKLINEGNLKGMLLEAARSRPSFDEVVPNMLTRGDLIFKKDEKLLYDLEKHTHQIPNEPPKYNPEGKYLHQDDFLIERNPDGSIVSYLRCSPPNKDKIPSCRHRFIDKGLLYQIRWPIRELPNWQKQRDAAIAFIDDMEKQAHITMEKINNKK